MSILKLIVPLLIVFASTHSYADIQLSLTHIDPHSVTLMDHGSGAFSLKFKDIDNQRQTTINCESKAYYGQMFTISLYKGNASLNVDFKEVKDKCEPHIRSLYDSLKSKSLPRLNFHFKENLNSQNLQLHELSIEDLHQENNQPEEILPLFQ